MFLAWTSRQQQNKQLIQSWCKISSLAYTPKFLTLFSVTKFSYNEDISFFRFPCTEWVCLTQNHSSSRNSTYCTEHSKVHACVVGEIETKQSPTAHNTARTQRFPNHNIETGFKQYLQRSYRSSCGHKVIWGRCRDYEGQ